MHAAARGAGVASAFALVLMAVVAVLFVGVVVTAGVTEKMSARAAGDALVWMGFGQLLSVAAFVAGFRWLARCWGGAMPPWWSQVLLGVLVAGVAAVLFVVAMVLMNR